MTRDTLRTNNEPLWLWFLITVVALLGLGAGLARADEASATIAVIDAQITARKAARPELPNDFNTQPDRQTEDRGSAPSMRVEAAGNLLGTLREVLGSDGKILFQPSGPIVISRPEATITLRPGTEITYQLGERSGVLTFGSPKPRIDAKVLGLRVSPDLSRLELTADNAGIATVESGPLKLSKKFKLQWDDTASTAGETQSTASSDTRPQVVFVTSETDWCGPCREQKPIAAAKAREDPKRRWSTIKTDVLPIEIDFEGSKYSISGVPAYVFRTRKGVVMEARTFESMQANDPQ